MDVSIKNLEELIEIGLFMREIPWSRKRLLFEKSLFKESKRFLNKKSYLDFAVRQLQRAYKEPTPKYAREALMEKIRFWQGFLKIEDGVLENREITYELMVLTSLLRVKAYKMNEKVVPLALTALYVLMALFSQGNKRPIYVMTYMNVFRSAAGRLMAFKDDADSRRRLLVYVKADRRRAPLLARNHTLVELADMFRLGIEERMKFVRESE